ncbi:putative spermidine/putrescine transport system ATP-binding protein [Bosea sp. OK403]|uniref:ABC transporter ATP-binding protein n=1 Tax=Bosea sp. OK403 TaxID=1855286 RepID=UPI0008EA5C75|nr:ABC transporter ATP-binding protein [Bosea sp. OK403]SFJ87058.1 putative spermidine/putrescine transport system ATP-binding protein [Bosea sp. OK403]
METARSLSLKSVTKSYLPGQNAVEAIDLDVAPGEFISFLGPSGSGKTTTLMMIAGFARPTRGEISIAGRQIDAVEPYDRNIGMVFQNYALFPHMNAAQNVGFPLRMRGVAKVPAQAKVKAALAMVGLAEYAGRAPAELSGGQQQRVALARALVFQPDLVLLDEPLGALDKTLREQMQMELKRIHRELGVTMVYVTHDQTEAMAMSDRIAVFNRGRIEQIGTPSEVYFTPKTRFVASFVGDSNLLSGKTREGGLVDVAGVGPIATSAGHVPPGKDVSILVRPETIRISSERAELSPWRNSITVEEIVNYGDSVLVLGRKAGQELRVRVPSMEMPDLRRGDECGIEWAPTRIHVIEH